MWPWMWPLTFFWKNFNIAPANLCNALRGPSWLCQYSSLHRSHFEMKTRLGTQKCHWPKQAATTAELGLSQVKWYLFKISPHIDGVKFGDEVLKLRVNFSVLQMIFISQYKFDCWHNLQFTNSPNNSDRLATEYIASNMALQIRKLSFILTYAVILDVVGNIQNDRTTINY